MKASAVLISLLLGTLTVALAQSPSPGDSPNFFGSAKPNVPDASTRPASAGSPVRSTTDSGDEKVRTASPKAPPADPNMKIALDFLNVAQQKLQSKVSTAPKPEALRAVESAHDALKKTSGDGRWHGHRAKAMDKINDAITELKAGDRSNKAVGDLDASIAEINLCIGMTK